MYERWLPALMYYRLVGIATCLTGIIQYRIERGNDKHLYMYVAGFVAFVALIIKDLDLIS